MGLALLAGMVLLIIGVVWWFRYPELRWSTLRRGWPLGWPRARLSAVSLIGLGTLFLVVVAVDRVTG